MMRTRHLESRSPQPEIDDAPLHPAVVRWLRHYAAAAADDERDRVVAGILEDLNASLLGGAGRRAGAPA